jgi:hypothetical protein
LTKIVLNAVFFPRRLSVSYSSTVRRAQLSDQRTYSRAKEGARILSRFIVCCTRQVVSLSIVEKTRAPAPVLLLSFSFQPSAYKFPTESP